MKRHFNAYDGDMVVILLDGKPLEMVFACRVGSNGWADCYSAPLRINKSESIKKRPRVRGKISISE